MNRKQKRLHEQLNAMSSEELLKTWQETDEEAWVPEAMKIIEEILKEREIEVPPRPQSESKEDVDENLTANQSKSTGPASTKSAAILKIAKVAKILSWVMLTGWGLLIPLSNFLQDYPFSYIIATFISSLAQGALYFFLLQVLAEGIYLLVRIEKNTS